MLKKFLTTSALAVTLASASLSQSGVQVTVDSRPLMFDQPPIMQGGRVLVPLRGIFESLGADVVYLPADRSIKATRGQTQVELHLGSRNALVNGQMTYLDVPAASFGGRTLVPLRFISEALGADVDWQAATRTVAITSPAGAPQPPTSQNPPQEQPPAEETRLEIQSVVHSANGVLRPGDRLQVVMTGDPDGQAFFDVLGAFENVPMKEVRPGRYEGTVTIPNNVDVRRGTVVGRLVGSDGRESQLEASRAISFGAGRVNEPGLPGAGYDLTPLPNSTVNSLRPTIAAQFDRAIRPETVRMLLDNQDVTGLAQVRNRQVRFVPTNNLYAGRHRVIVDALDQQGRSVRQDWSFNVGTGGGVYGVDTIQLFNLSNGMTVDRVFLVQGQTSPYATVRVIAQPNRDLIPGFLGVRGRRIEMQGVADASGRFGIRMDASALPSNTVLETTIQATDPSGRAMIPVNLNLTLR